ncbi:MAG TPA: gluconokinase [Hyphomicrobiaceae bacterium]|nr:gluconokinase [Hyphomicrobiaceae bacterium]
MRSSRQLPPTVILLMGVSGAGKSTTGKNLGRALGWPFRDADEFHPAANVAKMRSGHPLDDVDRAPWLAAIAAYIDERRAKEEPAIVSCSALKRRYRDVLLDGRPDVALVYLFGTRQMIGERLQRRRGHFMPATLLESQFAALEEPQPDERPLVVSVGLSPRRVVGSIARGLGLDLGAGSRR